MNGESAELSPEESWLTDLAQGAVAGATTGAVAGPWGALVGALAGAGLSAVQSATSGGGPKPQPPSHPVPPRPQAPPASATHPAAPAPTAPVPKPAPASAPATPTRPPNAAGASASGFDLQSLMPAIIGLAQALSAQMRAQGRQGESIQGEAKPFTRYAEVAEAVSPPSAPETREAVATPADDEAARFFEDGESVWAVEDDETFAFESTWNGVH